jgi:hypothetical protein
MFSIFKKKTPQQPWLKGFIRGEEILNDFMAEHNNKPSQQDMKAKLKSVFFNHCNSYSQKPIFDQGVIEYIQKYIPNEYKKVFDNTECYTP